MPEDRQEARRKTHPNPAREPTGPASSDAQAARRSARRQAIARRKGKIVRRIDWLARKRPILRFVLIFAICMGSYYALTATSTAKHTVFPAYLRLNATACATILVWLGEEAAANDTSVSSPQFTMRIARGCDAIEPSALFISAVVALPVAIWMRLLGIAAGTLVLMIVNLVRVVTLFFVGTRFPEAFDLMHFDIWQAIFIFLAVVLWVLWAIWAVRQDRKKASERLEREAA